MFILYIARTNHAYDYYTKLCQIIFFFFFIKLSFSGEKKQEIFVFPFECNVKQCQYNWKSKLYIKDYKIKKSFIYKNEPIKNKIKMRVLFEKTTSKALNGMN